MNDHGAGVHACSVLALVLNVRSEIARGACNYLVRVSEFVLIFYFYNDTQQAGSISQDVVLVDA